MSFKGIIQRSISQAQVWVNFSFFFPWDFYFLVTTVPCLIGMFCPLPEGVRDRTGWDDATRLSMLPDSRPVIVMAPKMCLRFWFPKGPACICAKLLQSCPTLQLYGLEPYGSSVHGILQARIFLSGLPCPLPGDLPNPGTELVSPALQVDSL